MNNHETKHKYKKYKNKYTKLKQLNEGYYLVHGTDSVHIKKNTRTRIYIFRQIFAR